MITDDDHEDYHSHDRENGMNESRSYSGDEMDRENGNAVAKLQGPSQNEVEPSLIPSLALPNRLAETQLTKVSKFRTTVITAIDEQEAYYTILGKKYEQSQKDNNNLREQLKEQSENLNNTQSVLAVAQQREKELSETNSNLDTTVKRLESRLNEVSEANSGLKTARRQATVANGKLKKMRKEKKTLNDQYEEVIDALITSEQECSRLSGKLDELEKEKGEIDKTLQSNLATAAKAHEKAQKDLCDLRSQVRGLETANIALSSRIEQLLQRIAVLGAEKRVLAISSDEAKAQARQDIERERLAMKEAQEALEVGVLEKQKLQDDLKASVTERDSLRGRVDVLEGEGFADERAIRVDCTELAAAKTTISTLSGMKAELQAARQQIEGLDAHMNTCPIGNRQ